jgi:sugar lactone lactonase YvrE
VFDARATTGEAPTWCEREQALYWIDVEGPALHRFDPATGEDIRWPPV